MKNGPYILLLAPKDYPGKKYRNKYVYEHHLVWWKFTKQLIPKGFEIHHKNGDHKDNRINNLQLLTSSQHKKEHGKIRKEKALLNFICVSCKKEHKLKGSVVRTKQKKNRFGLFCSRACLFLWQKGKPRSMFQGG